MTDPALPYPPAPCPTELPPLPDLSRLADPLVPVGWAAGVVLILFALFVFLLLPVAVFGHGASGTNARAILRDLLKLFRALLVTVRSALIFMLRHWGRK